MTPLPANKLKLEFKDNLTALNGQKSHIMAGKGRINAEISSILFDKLRETGIRTHYHSMESATELICDHVDMIPLEVVVRFKACGSIVKRLGIKQNTIFDTPIVELFYKRDDLGDPIINADHALFLNIATPEELAELHDTAKRCAVELKTMLETVDIELADIKLEFGRQDRSIVLADEISPDNCRLHDNKFYSTPLDKDVFRCGLGEASVMAAYQEALKRIRLFKKDSCRTSYF